MTSDRSHAGPDRKCPISSALLKKCRVKVFFKWPYKLMINTQKSTQVTEHHCVGRRELHLNPWRHFRTHQPAQQCLHDHFCNISKNK